jgi:hypothetical protein
MDCSLLNVTDYASPPRKHGPGQLVTNVLNEPALTPRGGGLQAIFKLQQVIGRHARIR